MKCFETKSDTYLALLQITSAASCVTLTFSCNIAVQLPYWSIIPVINRAPINATNDDDHYKAWVERKEISILIPNIIP